SGGRGRPGRLHPGGDEDGEPHRGRPGRPGRRGLRAEGGRGRHGPAPGLHRVGGGMTTTVGSIIGGSSLDDAPGGTLEARNPAHLDEIVAEAGLADPATFVRACRVAREAQQAWARTPSPIRGRAVQQIGRLVEANKEALARLITREIGKPYKESLGEVQEVIDTCDFFTSEGRRLYGQTVPSELPDKQLFTFRAPVGVASIITAGNFPVAVPSWYIIPALVCGNAVVW